MKLVGYAGCARALGLVFMLLAVQAPAVALADAPGIRGPEAAPAGRTGTAGWAAIEPLPPIGGLPEPTGVEGVIGQAGATAMPPATIYRQTGDQGDGVIGFAKRVLNPGNWVLDAGLGVVSASMQSIQQTLLGFVLEATGTEPPTELTEAYIGCGSALSLLFCTQPQDLLPAPYYDPGVGPRSQGVAAQGTAAGVLRTVWLALQPAAIAVLTLVFVVRLGRVMYAGPAAFQAEAKALVLPFLAACVLVGSTPELLRVLLSFFAALNNAILSSAALTSGAINIPYFTYLPLDLAPALTLGPTQALLALYLVLFIVFVVAWIRLAKLTLLLALAPLAGATLIDRSTSHMFGNWLAKVLELLMHQLGWTVAALVGSAILNTLVGAPLGSDSDTFITRTIGTTLILVFMLCQQQLFSGVFALAGGSSPVMGGAIAHVATGLGMAAGVHGMVKQDKPAQIHDRRSLRLVRVTNMLFGRGNGPDGPPPPPGGASRGGGGRPGGGVPAAPGTRARIAAGRPGAAAPQTAMVRVHAAPTPAAHTAPRLAPSATAAPPVYVAAGRERRATDAPAKTLPIAVGPNHPPREDLLRRLRAEAPLTGRPVWHAAPPALVSYNGTSIHRVSSLNEQRALRNLSQRSRAPKGRS